MMTVRLTTSNNNSSQETIDQTPKKDILVVQGHWNVKLKRMHRQTKETFLEEKEGKPSENDSIKSQISSKTSRGEKDSTKKRHQRHHKRQPGEQLSPIQVVTI